MWTKKTPGKKSDRYKFIGRHFINEIQCKELEDLEGNKSLLLYSDSEETNVFSFPTNELKDKWKNHILETIKGNERKRTFGVPLEILMAEREVGNDIPQFLELATFYLAEHALNEEGIFRLSGSARDIETLRRKIDKKVTISFEDVSVHSISGLVKLWIRKLPEPLMTWDLYDQFTNLNSKKKKTIKNL